MIYVIDTDSPPEARQRRTQFDVVFLEIPGDVPKWNVIKLVEAKGRRLVCMCPGMDWFGRNRPIDIWDWIRPDDLFDRSAEETDIVYTSPAKCPFYFVRNSVLHALPIWMVEECLFHWRETAACGRFENQFFPYIEAYITERKRVYP